MKEKIREQYPVFERVHEIELLLTYTIEDKVYEICDVYQTFQTLQVVKLWTKNRMKGTIDVRYSP